MHVTDFIHTYPFAISRNLADEVIHHYHTNSEWNQSSFSTSDGISPRTNDRVDMKEYQHKHKTHWWKRMSNT